MTKDRALINSSSQLNLAGRKKETIVVNGVKYFPYENETALEEASITGMTPGHTVVFPHRSKDSQTEKVCVIYLPTFDNDITRDQSSEDLTAGAPSKRNQTIHCTALRSLPSTKVKSGQALTIQDQNRLRARQVHSLSNS